MVLCLDDVKDFFPLLGGRVDTCWVVCANVQKNYGVVFGVLEIFSEALEVKTFGVGVVVAVVLPLLAHNFDKTSVERPGRIWSEDVDIFVGVPISKERETETEGTSSGYALSCGDATLLQLSVVGTVSKGKRLVNKRGNTFDGGILVIHVEFKNLFLSTADTFKDEWFVLIVTVDTHAE